METIGCDPNDPIDIKVYMVFHADMFIDVYIMVFGAFHVINIFSYFILYVHINAENTENVG